MARDLFQEAGIDPGGTTPSANSTGGRDLFAEAGIAPSTENPQTDNSNFYPRTQPGPLGIRSQALNSMINFPGDLANVVSGAVKGGYGLLKGGYSAVTSPVETAKGVYKFITGNPNIWGAISDDLMSKYGSVENIGKTLEQHPAQFLTDASALLSGIGGITKGVGKLTGSGAVSNAGKMISGAAGAVDPFQFAVKPAMKVGGQLADVVGSNLLGTLTGTGKEAIRGAFQGGKNFTDALRGKTSANDVLDNAIGEMQDMVFERGANYRKQLESISQQPDKLINPNPVYNKLQNDIAKNYRIDITPSPDGGPSIIDMSRSTLDRSARPGVTELIHDVMNWDDWTPVGADALRQRIGDFYSPSKNSSALVSQLKDTLKNQITKQVPEYSDMLSQYEKASNDIAQVKKLLMNGDVASRDTALRKMGTIMNDVNWNRLDTLGKLDERTGGQLKQQVAGNILSQWSPRGLLTKYGGLGLGMGSAYAGHPLVGAGIMAAESPRLTGEAVNLLGNAARGAEAVSPYLPDAKYLYELNKTQGEDVPVNIKQYFNQLLNKQQNQP